jgi:hypothetical protein
MSPVLPGGDLESGRERLMSEPTKPGSICRWIVGGPVGLPPGITEFRIPAEVYWCGDYFLCRGETWTIVFGGVPLHLQDRSIGLKYIQVLLANPGRHFHVHDLIDECLTGRDAAARGRRRLMDKTDLAESNLEEGRLGDAGEVLDDPALRSYRDRLRKLASEREEADKVSDIEWLVRIDDETAAIERQLRSKLQGAAPPVLSGDREAAEVRPEAHCTSHPSDPAQGRSAWTPLEGMDQYGLVLSLLPAPRDPLDIPLA